jgi:hypothetical protein
VVTSPSEDEEGGTMRDVAMCMKGECVVGRKKMGPDAGPDRVIKFGRYAGMRVGDVPDEWLEWWLWSHEFRKIPKFVLVECHRRGIKVVDISGYVPSFIAKPRF